MTNIAMVQYRWPIEIDGLAVNSMVIFHGYVTNNQRVYIYIICAMVIFHDISLFLVIL